MNRARFLLFLPLLSFLLFAAGCATQARPKIKMSSAQAQVESVLYSVLQAAENKDFARLDSYHLFGPGFTKFPSAGLLRLDAEAARQEEHTSLAAIDHFRTAPEAIKIDIFGETAIATFILKYSFTLSDESFQRQARTTMVFVKTNDGWKITHEHLSLPPAP